MTVAGDATPDGCARSRSAWPSRSSARSSRVRSRSHNATSRPRNGIGLGSRPHSRRERSQTRRSARWPRRPASLRRRRTTRKRCSSRSRPIACDPDVDTLGALEVALLGRPDALRYGAHRRAVPARRPVPRREDDHPAARPTDASSRSTPPPDGRVDEWRVADDGLVVGTLGEGGGLAQKLGDSRAPRRDPDGSMRTLVRDGLLSCDRRRRALRWLRRCAQQGSPSRPASGVRVVDIASGETLRTIDGYAAGWLSVSGDGTRLAIESNAAPWTVTTVDIDSGDPVGPTITLAMAGHHRAQSRRRPARDRCPGRSGEARLVDVATGEIARDATARRPPLHESRSAVMARSWPRSDSRTTSVCSTRPTAHRSSRPKVRLRGCSRVGLLGRSKPPPRGEHRAATSPCSTSSAARSSAGPSTYGPADSSRSRPTDASPRSRAPSTTTVALIDIGTAEVLHELRPTARESDLRPTLGRLQPGRSQRGGRLRRRATASLPRSRSSRRWTGSRSAT